MYMACFFRVRDYENMDAEFFQEQKSPIFDQDKQNPEMAAGGGEIGLAPPVFTPQDLCVLESRLGRIHMSSHLNMEKRPRLCFDLSLHEDRQLLRMLLTVAYKEGGSEAFKASGTTFANPRYGPAPNRTLVAQTAGVPLAWVTNVPVLGFFEVDMTGEIPKLELGCRKDVWRRFAGWEQ